MLIVSVCGATALLSCAYSLTLPNVYSATAKVLPPQKESPGISSMLGQMGGLAAMAGGKGNDSELYLALLKSRSVEAAVIQRLNLGKRYHTKNFNQTWQRLDGAVKVQGGKDGIISITAEDQDPKEAAILANTMADELARIMVRLNLSKAGSERIFLEKRLELVKRDLQTAENDLKGYAQRNRIAQVESQAAASVSGVARMRSEVAAKEVQLAALRTSQSDESFEVKELQAAIKRLKESVAGLAGKSYDGGGIPAIGSLPGIALEYARKLRELKTQEALFEQLTKQYELAKMNEAKDSSSLQVLDEAIAPEEKVRPKRASFVIMATVVAFFSSVLLAFLLEYTENLTEEQKEIFDNLRRQALSLR